MSQRVCSQTAWLRLTGQGCLWGTSCRDSQPEALMAPPFALHLALVSWEASSPLPELGIPKDILGAARTAFEVVRIQSTGG